MTIEETNDAADFQLKNDLGVLQMSDDAATDPSVREELRARDLWVALKAVAGRHPETAYEPGLFGWAITVLGVRVVRKDGSKPYVMGVGDTFAKALEITWERMTVLNEGEYLLIRRRPTIWGGPLAGFVDYVAPEEEA